MKTAFLVPLLEQRHASDVVVDTTVRRTSSASSASSSSSTTLTATPLTATRGDLSPNADANRVEVVTAKCAAPTDVAAVWTKLAHDAIARECAVLVLFPPVPAGDVGDVVATASTSGSSTPLLTASSPETPTKSLGRTSSTRIPATSSQVSNLLATPPASILDAVAAMNKGSVVAFSHPSEPSIPLLLAVHADHVTVFHGVSLGSHDEHAYQAMARIVEVYDRFPGAVTRVVTSGDELSPLAVAPAIAWLRSPSSTTPAHAHALAPPPPPPTSCSSSTQAHVELLRERVLNKAKPRATLDVVVPAYRADKSALDRILALRAPADALTVTFTLQCDNPDSQASRDMFASLARENAHRPDVRLGSNAKNAGAPLTRNAGKARGMGDWVLFLDDDVVPREGLLAACADAIEAFPNATGFVGVTVLPRAQTLWQDAVYRSGVANGFAFEQWSSFLRSARSPTPSTSTRATTENNNDKFSFALGSPRAWGITANLCIRREDARDVEFLASFPKSGGGEDVDFCLRLDAAAAGRARSDKGDGRGFVFVPHAVVDHPYWNILISHFVGWSRGDGALLDMHPHMTFMSLPNLAEALVFGAALVVPGMAWAVSARVSWAVVVGCVTALALVVADVAREMWLGFERGSIGARAPVQAVHGAVLTIVIRLAYELGRLYGHYERGRLRRNALRRFRWRGIGNVDEDEEWADATRAWGVRVAVVGVAWGVLYANS